MTTLLRRSYGTHVDALVVGILHLPDPLVVVVDHPLLPRPIRHEAEDQLGHLSSFSATGTSAMRDLSLTFNPDLPRLTYFILCVGSGWDMSARVMVGKR
jgi:hypothetical protein